MDLMRMVDKMPAFPASVQRVVELTSDIQCNPKDLVNALDHDPVLTAKILKVRQLCVFWGGDANRLHQTCCRLFRRTA